jgi:hypothetical protein
VTIECALFEGRDFNAAPAASHQRLAAAAWHNTGEALNLEPNFGFKFMLCSGGLDASGPLHIEPKFCNESIHYNTTALRR